MLILFVIILDQGERGEQGRGLEKVDAAVDLADSLLLVGSVLFLYHPQQVSPGIFDDQPPARAAATTQWIMG